MATIDKNFRIKNGLVVEGTTGTINGQTILTETGGDTYILNLVGGATLVKSVESTQLEVSGAGKLSVKSGVFDAAGAAAAAQTAAEGYADSLAPNYDAAGAAAAAQTAAEGYADSLASNYDPAGAAGLAEIAANDYTDGRETAITTAYQTYADQAETDAKAYADSLATNYDAAGAASTAQTNAEGYADSLIDDTSIATTKIWSAYKTSTEIAAAQQGAEDYTDTAVSNLVNGAPELLDTLNELAQALQDNPDIISDLQDVAAGKQDTLTAGSNIDITGTTISVTGLDSADISDFNTAALSATSSAYDAAGAASTAQTNAESYADGVAGDAYDNAVTYANGLAGNYDAAGAAGTAESNANSYTDAEISDVLDGTSFFTSINVNDVASQVAATTGNIVTAAATTAIAWAKADYRSAKFLVKVKNGNHTQVSDLVVTLDTSDNIGVSEYGITYSNGTSLADVSADVSGANVRIRVTPVNANTEVVVVGTLIK